MSVPFDVELLVVPDRVGSGDEPVSLTAAVANRGASAEPTELHRSRLLVDGEPSWSWEFAIANGARDERELSLPPGERVDTSREFKASTFGPAGDHELVLEVRGVRSPPVHLIRRG